MTYLQQNQFMKQTILIYETETVLKREKNQGEKTPVLFMIFKS